MMPKICAVVLLAFCALVSQAQAQECVAQSVINMNLTAYHILSWEVREDEPCEINQFLVYIYERDRPIEYSFEVNEPWVDVSFLEVCHEWTFVVIPVSEHTRGHEHRLFASIPLPADADLSIAYLNVTRNGVTGELHLAWDLSDPDYGSCSVRYRLTIEEENSAEITDIYLSERSVNLHFLSPCTTYQFGVRAINIAHPTIEGPIRIALNHIPASKQTAPLLELVNQGVTGFNTTWRLESVFRNRCKVEELFIDGSPFFNKTAMINEDDGPHREPIQLSFTSLTPNSMYYLRAYVLNSGGWSEPTVVAIQTLELSPDEEETKESV